MKYSRVFELVSPVVYNCILCQIFSAKFIEFYREKREGENRINFYTAALLFGEFREKKLSMRSTNMAHFVTKNKKRNVGF